jgi:hypothetical protein
MSKLSDEKLKLNNNEQQHSFSFRDLKIKSYNSSISELYKYTKPLKNVQFKDLPTSGKVVLLICNPYFNTSFKLGNPVCNDCKIISEKYLSHDYLSYCLFDGTADEFKKYISFFLNQKFDDFVIYYSGHGIQIEQHSNDFRFDYSLSKYVSIPENEIEEDGKDECLVFSGNSDNECQLIYDDELTKLIKSNKCKNVLMICDCCHARTLLDSLPNNTCLLTSCADSEKSVQLIDNGIFTYYITKFFDLPLTELINTVQLKLTRYYQTPSKSLLNNREYMFL